MKNDIPGTIRRAERFQIILIGEGLLVGAAAGLVVLLYRVALEYAGAWLTEALEFAGRSAAYMAGWFVILLAMAWLVSRLVSFEPMISGSGIPQLKGEMTGRFDSAGGEFWQQNSQADFYAYSADWLLAVRDRRYR